MYVSSFNSTQTLAVLRMILTSFMVWFWCFRRSVCRNEHRQWNMASQLETSTGGTREPSNIWEMRWSLLPSSGSTAWVRPRRCSADSWPCSISKPRAFPSMIHVILQHFVVGCDSVCKLCDCWGVLWKWIWNWETLTGELDGLLNIDSAGCDAYYGALELLDWNYVSADEFWDTIWEDFLDGWM